jgi:pimeloyl-ACP methyl ester carboxylesterase
MPSRSPAAPDPGGDGSPRPPLVLLGGSPTGRPVWTRVGTHLADHFRLVELDAPDAVGWPAGARPVDAAAGLATEIVRLDQFPAHLVASPFAAGSAVELALDRPDLLRSLVLVGPIGEVPVRPSREASALRGLGRALAEQLDGGDDPGASATWARIVEADGPREAPGSSAGPAGGERAGRYRDHLLPSQVVHGSRDPPFLQSAAAEWVERLPGAHSLRLPDADPRLLAGDPARLAVVILSFCLRSGGPSE